MLNIYQQDLDFLEEAKRSFGKHLRYETHRNDENTHIALRYGEDRDCIMIYRLGEKVMFANNIMDVAPQLVVEGECEKLDEIEEGYKVQQSPIKPGDWVARTRTRRTVTYSTDNEGVVFRVSKLVGVGTVYGEDGNNHAVGNIRHATPEERTWAELGRPVKDFRDKDVLVIRDLGVRMVSEYYSGPPSDDLISVECAKGFYNDDPQIRFYPAESAVYFEGGEEG